MSLHGWERSEAENCKRALQPARAAAAVEVGTPPR